jgi:hypothetical protein
MSWAYVGVRFLFSADTDAIELVAGSAAGWTYLHLADNVLDGEHWSEFDIEVVLTPDNWEYPGQHRKIWGKVYMRANGQTYEGTIEDGNVPIWTDQCGHYLCYYGLKNLDDRSSRLRTGDWIFLQEPLPE